MLNNLYDYFQAFFIICGIWVIGKFFWMIVYEIKYKMGDEYMRFGKEYVVKKYGKQK